MTSAPGQDSVTEGVGTEAGKGHPDARHAGGEHQHPERFDPQHGAGKLIDSEHRGRYWWASQAVSGLEILDAGCGVGYGSEILASAGAASVTAVDIDEGAVGEARSRFGDLADSFICADICRLTLLDDSFDVVVCFETIQQVVDSERALGELHRVLRPGGLLLISSPSPDVYEPGNEHHVHEYRPTELSAVVEERFAHVTRYRQHPWLASTIEPAANGSTSRHREIRATAELEPGAETYSILAASDAELPCLDDLVTLGHDFEVKWWAEQVSAAESRADGGLEESDSSLRERIAEMEESDRLIRERIKVVEQEASVNVAAAKAHAQGEVEAVERLSREQQATQEGEAARALAQAVAAEAAAKTRLQEVGTALLEANQSLAQLPALQHRFEELQALRAHIKTLEGSRSWRYMAPLRRIRRLFSRQR